MRMNSYILQHVLFLLSATFVHGLLPECRNTTHCVCSGTQLQCSGLSDLAAVPGSSSVHHLQLLDCQLSRLQAGQLQKLPKLHSLAVENCSVQELAGPWHQNRLTHLSLAHNRIQAFRLQWLEGLSSLRTLNLSQNPLHNLEDFEPISEGLGTLDLSGGDWNCTEHSLTWLLHWSLRPGRQLTEERHIRCSESRKQYRTMDGHNLLEMMQLTQAMLDRCPSGEPWGCSCDLVQVEAGAAGALQPVIVEVNCDNRGLTRFPPALPDNTTTLYIRNNSLTGFGPVISNQSDYQALTGLYLDGNQLTAEGTGPLEGSAFIHRFSILSLSRNRLQTLPLYAFGNAFKKRSFNVDSLFLGDNPWLCSCDSPFTFTFQTWLATQHKLIRDRTRIRCGSGSLAEAAPSPGQPVLALSRQELCGEPHRQETNWWDVANGLLTVLLLLLICTFAFDVTRYRRTGKLPLVVRYFPC